MSDVLAAIPAMSKLNQISSVGQSQPMGDYSPEVQAELSRQERRRQLYNLLLQQGLSGGPAYQSAGRFIVPRGWAANLGDLAKVAAGVYGNIQADRAGKQAIDEETSGREAVMKAFQEKIAATPAQPERFISSQESAGGEAMPEQLPSAAKVQQAILEAQGATRNPNALRTLELHQRALDQRRIQEDTQKARAAEAAAASEQRNFELEQKRQAQLPVGMASAKEADPITKTETILGPDGKPVVVGVTPSGQVKPIGAAPVPAGDKPKLNKDERLRPDGSVEIIPGTATFRTQKDKSTKDWNAAKIGLQASDSTVALIDKILDPKKADAFGKLYGGLTAYATRELPSDEIQNIRNAVEQLRSNFKATGLQIMRQGGSPGVITEREWPIMEDLVARLSNPRIGVQEAKDILTEVKTRVQRMGDLMRETYDNEWANSQFYKPMQSETRGGTGSAPVASPPASAPAKAAAPKRMKFDAQGNPVK